MKRPTWIVEHFSDINGFQYLAQSVKSAGRSCIVVTDGEIPRNLKHPVIYQGSFELIDKLGLTEEDYYWKTTEKFNFSSYAQVLKSFLLNKDYRFLTLSDFAASSESIVSQQGAVFIRPDSGLKSFSGTLVKKESLAEDLKNLLFYDPPLDSQCVISSPKTLHREWRMICISGHVITGSQYKKDGKFALDRECPNDVIHLAESIANSYQPDTAFMIDIAESEEKFYLIELNNFSTSALYLADTDKIAAELFKITEPN